MTETSSTVPPGQDVSWLTQEAYDRLRQELDYLEGDGRVDIARKIEQAREEGDLRENGGYHAAKEEQGKQEARIRQLQQLLDNAKVGEPVAAAAGVVAPGSVVTVDLAGSEERFLLGSRESAGDTEIDVYSEKSPLGEAINGRKVGDTVAYTAPNGREFSVTIRDVRPFTG